MFKFNQLKQLHLEITNNCQASCPMCTRNVHGGQENPLIKIQSWTLDEFKTIVSPEVLGQIETMYFCGNFGDPMLNNDLIEMCRYVKDTAPTKDLNIHTNGSARTTAWWAELAQALPASHRVVFALDGLADTHSLYRIGTDFKKILENAKAFINAGGRAEWCFIKFKHNEHQVEEARALAKKIGFAFFVEKNSTRFVGEPRFDVRDKQGNVLYYLEPPTTNTMTFIDKKTIDSWKSFLQNSEISCQSMELKEVYIDAYKNLYPCCWIGSIPYVYIEKNDYAKYVRHEMVRQYDSLINALGWIDQLSALKRPIREIIESPRYQTVWQKYWEQKRLLACARACGKMKENNISKPRDQEIARIGLNE